MAADHHRKIRDTFDRTVHPGGARVLKTRNRFFPSASRAFSMHEEPARG